MTTVTEIPTLTIKRHIKAPRERVFDAWTQPQHLKHWWGAAEGFTTPIADVDLKIGGKYRLGMLPPNETVPHVVGGEFKEIDRPNKLVYSWKWEGQESPSGTMTVTVVFLSSDAGTDVLLTHTGFITDEDRGKHEHGWNGVIDNLTMYLKG